MNEATASGKRVAFFGGSFDPPHLGHLAVARAARAALGLDTVLFAPVGAQPLKPHGSTAGFEDRLAMTRLAVAGEPGFAVSLVDAPKPACAPNFTLETLLGLRTSRPGQRLDDLKAALPEGIFIESAPDTARTGSEVEVRFYLLRNSAGESAPFYVLPGLNVEISASDIREQVRAASGARTKGHELLSGAVSDYIRAHNLYR